VKESKHREVTKLNIYKSLSISLLGTGTLVQVGGTSLHCTFDRNKKFSSASKVVRLVFAQRFITIFNCHYHTSNNLSVYHKHTSLSPINCQSVDNCCIIINTLINHHDPIYLERCQTDQYDIHLYHSYLSAFFVSAGVPNGEFPEILIAKCRSRFFVFDFFHGRKILKVDGRDRNDPQNREKNAPVGRFTCMCT
jgi:hypothetical protein